jgi:hypothetical protein
MAADLQAHATRAVPGRMVHMNVVFAEHEGFAALVKHVYWWRLLNGDAEQCTVRGRLVIKEEVVSVKMNRETERALGAAHPAHVIDMRVRQQDGQRRQSLALDEGQQLVHLIARVDEHRFAGLLTSDDVSVLEEWLNGR